MVPAGREVTLLAATSATTGKSSFHCSPQQGQQDSIRACGSGTGRHADSSSPFLGARREGEKRTIGP